eukprot:2260618-Alexandrium_andersonii.AAC.1
MADGPFTAVEFGKHHSPRRMITGLRGVMAAPEHRFGANWLALTRESEESVVVPANDLVRAIGTRLLSTRMRTPLYSTWLRTSWSESVLDRGPRWS